MRLMSYEEVLAKLTAMCSTAEYCSYDMLQKMHRWEVDEATQERVMDYLLKEKYVDDGRFCRLFVREKIRFSKWGRRKIEMSLAQKRIPREISAPILDEVDDEEYLSVLRPMLRQKARSVKAASDYDRNGKLIRFAMGRGFTFDLIRQCLTGDMEEVDEDSTAEDQETS